MGEYISFNIKDQQENQSVIQGMVKSIWHYFMSLDKFTKLFLITAVLLTIATPVLVSNLLQTKQHAGNEQPQLYFALHGSKTPITNPTFVKGETVLLDVYLDGKTENITGFDIAAALASNNTLVLAQPGVTEGADANKFSVSLINNWENNRWRYTKVNTKTDSIITGPIFLATIPFTALSSGVGTFDFTIDTAVTSAASAVPLSVAKYALAYTVADPTPIPTPTTVLGSTSCTNYVFAGKWGGTNPLANRITYVKSMATDSQGNIYVAYGAYIYKYDANGNPTLSFGGYGSGDGQFSNYATMAMGIDRQGNIYVADNDEKTYANAVNAVVRIQKFDSSGRFITKWGEHGSGDGQFIMVNGIATDNQGNVYATDSTNMVVTKFDSNHQFIKKWQLVAQIPDPFRNPSRPSKITIDNNNNIYISDNGSYSNNGLYKFDSNGNFIAKFTNGAATGLATDNQGNIYRAFGSMVKKFDSNGNYISPINLAANVIAIDNRGNLYGSGGDLLDDNIFKLSSDGNLIKSWGISDQYFDPLGGIATDSRGNVYATDTTFIKKSFIKKFSPTGQIISKWGSNYSNPPSSLGAGEFYGTLGSLAVDNQGNVYVLGGITNNGGVQKFDSNGNFISRFTAVNGSGNGQFGSPVSIAINSQGNIYIGDSAQKVVQKFSPSWQFINKYGNGSLWYPFGIAIDAHDNFYVTESSNSDVKKFDSEGRFIKSWGNEITRDGRGSSVNGQFNVPIGIATDNRGNVYVVDVLNNRIQKFDSDGHFITKFGTKGTGDGQFNYIQNGGSFSVIGIAVDNQGNVYVADVGNHRIQKFACGSN